MQQSNLPPMATMFMFSQLTMIKTDALRKLFLVHSQLLFVVLSCLDTYSTIFMLYVRI
uniref:Alpha-1 3/1 6-mannosyltransferase ALG2-like n=1 Tax=Rhizophora mucronata TaxID=61149 RepID=A0A2P2L1G9_RHIMU